MSDRKYGHLLSSAFRNVTGKKDAVKDTADDHEGHDASAPPADDKEDGKKGKKAGKKAKKAGEGDKDDDREDKDSDDGEEEENEETDQEDEEDDEEDNLDKKRGKKGKKATRAQIETAFAARVKKILSSDEAQDNPKAAMSLALDTRMPATEAIAFLSINSSMKPASRKLAIDSRMETTRSPSVGMDAENPAAAQYGNPDKMSDAAFKALPQAAKVNFIQACGAMRRGEVSSVSEGLKKL